MNTTKHKPNLAAQMAEQEMPEYKGKWRNYFIPKRGAAQYGIMLYSNKDDAETAGLLLWLVP